MSKRLPMSMPLLLAFGTAFGFVVTDALIKFMGQSLPVPQIAFLRSAGGMVLLIGAFVVAHRSIPPKIEWTQHFIRGVLIAAATLCFYTSLAHFEFVVVAAVALLGQVVSALFGNVFFKERFSFLRVVAMGLGIAGAICFLMDLGLFTAQIAQIDFLILPLLAIPFLEACILTLIKLQTQKEPVIVTSTIQAILVTVIFAPGLAVGYLPPTAFEWMILAMTCIIGALVSYISIAALKDLPISVFAITDNTSLLWAGIIGFIFFAEWPSVTQIIGGSLIVGCCYLLARDVSAA